MQVSGNGAVGEEQSFRDLLVGQAGSGQLRNLTFAFRENNGTDRATIWPAGPSAAQSGRAEITITPQAWLGARANGLAPGITAYVSSLANQHLLPEPSGHHTLHLGKEVRTSVTDRTRELEQQHNQLLPAR